MIAQLVILPLFMTIGIVVLTGCNTDIDNQFVSVVDSLIMQKNFFS